VNRQSAGERPHGHEQRRERVGFCHGAEQPLPSWIVVAYAVEKA
jgi:hypothetical protein